MFGILAESSSGNVLLPPSASTIAPEIDWLTWFIIWVSIIFGAMVFLGTVWIGWRYHYRPGRPEKGVGPTHSNLLEITWSVIPGIIVFLIAIWGFEGYIRYNVAPPETPLEIQVEGQKWSWAFTYPNGYFEPVLHIPKGVPVRFVLSSKDVIHSLYFPEFRVKKDVVPGRYNKLWVQATQTSTVLPGSPLAASDSAWDDPDNFNFDFEHVEKTQDGFDIYCAEYCGTKHSKMLSKVYVHPNMESFNAWLKQASDPFRVGKDGKVPNTTEVGQKLAAKGGCFQCHSVDGKDGIGTTWKDMFGKQGKFTDNTDYTADENYIKDSIINPQKHIVAGKTPAMPSYQGKFSDREITAIINYMKSISANYKGIKSDLDAPLPDPKKKDATSQPASQPAN